MLKITKQRIENCLDKNNPIFKNKRFKELTDQMTGLLNKLIEQMTWLIFIIDQKVIKLPNKKVIKPVLAKLKMAEEE